MLIDYERKHHPETYDATKTVGKIEGYQELTNKLQRCVNVRAIHFIVVTLNFYVPESAIH